MKTSILFLGLLFTIHLFAQQPCTDEDIMAIKGKWEKRPDANMKPGNQSQILSRLDKMQKVLQAAYAEPTGAEAGWYRSMGGYYSSLVKSSDSYELTALIKTYYCNTALKKLLPGTEASCAFYIWVNTLKWFAQADENFLIDNKPVYLLTKKIGVLKDFDLYAGNGNSSLNTGQTFSRTILISRANLLPYIPVTRMQYLEVFLRKKEENYKKYEESLLKMPVRNDAEEEEYKKQQLEIVVSRARDEQSKERAKTNFLRGYKTAKQRQQEDITKAKEVYQRDIKVASDLLNNSSSEELAKPAYMENTSYAGSFLRFASENQGMMMIQINEGYFNKKLPAYVPQFVIVYWNWNTEKPSLDYAGQIEKDFNFKALQEMLDK